MSRAPKPLLLVGRLQRRFITQCYSAISLQSPPSLRLEAVLYTTHNARRVLSLRRSVVSVTAVHLQPFMVSGNLDCAVAAVVTKIRRAICERILTAQVSLYLREGIGYVRDLEWLEPAPTSGVSNALQNLVVFAAFRIPGKVCADRINDHIRPQRHFDRFFASNPA